MTDKTNITAMPDTEPDIAEVVIEAARETFTRYGFKKTTMEEIARSVYKGKSSIYYYFKSKADIFNAVLEKENSILREELKRATDLEKTPQEKLRSHLVTRMHVLAGLPNLCSALRDETLRHHAFIQRLRKNSLEDDMKMIIAILKEGVEKGVFRIRDVRLVAEGISTAFRSLESLWDVQTYPSTEVERNIDTVLDLLFHGIVIK